MSKSKEMAKPAATALVSQNETEQKPPEKKTGRELVSRSLNNSALLPPDGSPSLARAGEMVARPGSAGASGRAKMANSVQSALGNSRLNRMVSQSANSKGMPGRMGAGPQVPNPLSKMPSQPGHGMAPSSPPFPLGGRAAPSLHRQVNGTKGPESVPASVGQAMQSSPGAPLPNGVRSKMEDSFGADFGGVRVHTGDKAAQAAQDINASAFTHGQDIYFNQSQYQPGTTRGDKLLAHELTHTIQQGDSNDIQAKSADGAVLSQPGDADEQQAEKIADQVVSGQAINPHQLKSDNSSHPVQRDLPAFALELGVSYLVAVEIGRRSVYELRGSPTFDPGLFLKVYLYDSNYDADVNVRYGSLAEGKIRVRKDSVGDYYAGPTALPLKLPDIAPPGGGKSLSLFVWFDPGNKISGEIGVSEFSPVYSKGPAYRWQEEQDRFLKLLTGHTGDHGEMKTLKLQNELDHGVINFWYIFQNELYVGTTVYGGFTLFDDQLISSMKLSTSGKGFLPGETKLERDRTGDLFGKLELRNEWEGKHFSGTLRGTYEDGILEIQGTLKYVSPRLKGEVNVLATEESRAWQAIQAQLADIQSGGKDKAQPPALGGEAGPGTGGSADGNSRLALTGWGVLNLVVTDKINADAAFVVDPDGYLTLRGTLRAPHKITLMEAKPTKEKTFFDENWSEMVYVAWAAGVRAMVYARLSGSAVFGPLTLHDITLTGVFSTRPDSGSEIEISAKLNLSASARAHLEAGGELAVRVGSKRSYLGVNLASVNLGIDTVAEVLGVVEATPTIKRQTKGSGSGDETPKYVIGGELFVGGQLNFKLSGKLEFSAVGLSHTIDLGKKVYPVAGFGVTTDVAYTLGSDETPEVKYRKGSFEAHRFIRNIIKEKRPDDKEIETSGGFKEDGKEKGHLIPSDTVPPEPPQTPKTQEVPFRMMNKQHSLFLTEGGQGEPVTLKMSSEDPKPVETKIQKAEDGLTDAKQDPDTDKPTQEKIDRRIDDLEQISRDAVRVEAAAKKLGSEPEAPQADVPGLKELGDEIHTYGERYLVSDLGEPTPGQAHPLAQPKNIENIMDGLEESLVEARGAIANSKEIFRSNEVGELRADPINKKWLAGQEAEVDDLGRRWPQVKAEVDELRDLINDPLYMHGPQLESYVKEEADRLGKQFDELKLKSEKIEQDIKEKIKEHEENKKQREALKRGAEAKAKTARDAANNICDENDGTNRPAATVGDGSTEAAVREEIRIGKPIKSPAGHHIKGLESVRGLKNAVAEMNEARPSIDDPVLLKEIDQAVVRANDRMTKLQSAQDEWEQRAKTHPEIWHEDGSSKVQPGFPY